MYKSSRAFDANERVQRYRKSVSAVHENILLFKGFLGPTLKDNDALQSVGMRAARAAGVIVDSAGKLRCPPGTPNANQFTDMQMSNCLVPSAETLAAQAVNAVQRFVDGFRFKKGRLAKHKVDQKPANLGIPDADGSNVPVGAFDDSLGITNIDDAISAVANGADLSQIPDEFLIEAIYENRIPYDLDRGDWAKGSDKRFQVIGTGGGVHGMTRFLDTKTGQLLGVKYQTSPADAKELASEVLAASVLEEFGYPAMSMRAVKGENGSMGIVTELIHNKYEGEINHDYETQKATVDSLVHAFLFDLVVANDDRHYGNYLLVDNGENVTIAPIDHGLAIMNQGGSIFNEDGKVSTYSFLLSRSNPFKTGLFNFFGTRPPEKKDRAELFQAIEKSLSDIREIDADALGEKLKNILNEISNGYTQQKIKESLSLMASRPDDDTRDYGQGAHTISDIDALVGRIKELQNKSATEIADAFFPDRDYIPQDPASQLDSFALDLDIPTPDLANGEILSEFGEDTAGVNPFASVGEGAPLVSAREAKGYVGVSFDSQQFNNEAIEKFDSFVAEHVPNQLGDLEASDLNKIEKSMKLIPTKRDMSQQIDDAIAWIEDPSRGQREIWEKLLEAKDSPQEQEYLRAVIAEWDSVLEELKTPEGREKVKARMVKNYAQIMQGIDDMQKKHPMLQGKISLDIENGSRAGWHAGRAMRRSRKDGTVYLHTEMTPGSLLFDTIKSDEGTEDGDMLAKIVRMNGTDSYQLSIGVHEVAHLVHYDQNARNIGFEIGAGSPPLIDQLSSAGPNIGDSYLGLLFAKQEGIDPEMPISDVKNLVERKYGTDYQDYPERFADFINSRALEEKIVDKENPAHVLANILLSDAGYFEKKSNKQRLFYDLLDTMKDKNGRWNGSFKQPSNLQTSEDMEKLLSEALGQDFSSFVKEFQDAISTQFGYDFADRNSGGVDPTEVQNILGKSSIYGNTELVEGVAEAATLNYFLENFQGARIADETQVNQIKDLLEKVIPTKPEKATTKKINAQVKQMLDRLFLAMDNLPELEREEIRI